MHAKETRRPKTMFPPAWTEARNRAGETLPAGPDEYLRLIGLVEQGGEQFGKLQALYDQRQELADPGRHLLDFIDDDLSDLFRCIAAGAAGLLPGAMQAETADPPEVQADVRVLARYFAVAALAAENPGVPGEVRHVFRTVAGGLEDWDEEFIDTVQRIADRYLHPGAEVRG
jgi:hypothetical protein